MSIFYQRFRRGEPPPPVRLYALGGSAPAIRASHAAASASGERVFGDRLTWLTPRPGGAQRTPSRSLYGRCWDSERRGPGTTVGRGGRT
jgi:hypothetical protein